MGISGTAAARIFRRPERAKRSKLAACMVFSCLVSVPAFSETIPLKQNGGTFELPVRINDAITLDFTLDSGASTVMIPADVMLTLMRAHTIRDSDFLGTQTYTLADGSKLPSVRFVLRELKVGEHILRDVPASVAPVDGALLLGQSFLANLPRWSIDNRQHALILEGEAQDRPIAAAPLNHASPPKVSTPNILGLHLGENIEIPAKTMGTPIDIGRNGTYFSRKWRTSAGAELSATYVPESGKIVYVELDPSGGTGPGSTVFGVVIGRTTLDGIRAKFGSNGFGFQTNAVTSIGSDILNFNCYSPTGISDTIIVFVTKTNLSKIKSLNNGNGDSVLDAVIMADASYLRGIWGQQIVYDPAYRSIDLGQE